MTDRGRALLDLTVICEQLNAKASTLAPELLPRGRREGPYWVDAKTSNGGMGDSLKVDLRTGKWRWFAEEKYGDMLDLYMLVFDVSKVDAIKWARGELGLAGPVSAATRRDLEERRRQAAQAREAKQKDEAEDLEKKRAAAKGVWLGGSPDLLAAGPLRGYLEARDIDLERLVRLGWGLGSLRFAPKLWHPYAKANFPAMLALAIFPDGRTASLHRTYLVERNGRWDRLRDDLDGHSGKLLYCSIHGGVIPLWRGMRPSKRGTGEVLAGYNFTDDRAGPDLRLIEGIENGLSVVQLDVDRRLAATYSLSNVCQLKLPRHYRHLTFIRDNDAPGSAADSLLERALDHLAELADDDELYLVTPPAGAKDFNDAIKTNTASPSHDRPHDGSESRPE